MANSKTESGVREDANRLLEAFYDAAGGKLTQSVPLGGEEAEEDGAAERAGLASHAIRRDEALKYLLNQGYVQAAEDGTGYTLTLAGSDLVREEIRPVISGFQERGGMDDKTQRRLLTLVSTVIALGISQPITNYIAEQIPERRGIKDDLLEAFLQGVVRAVSIFIASVAVRKVAGWRGGS